VRQDSEKEREHEGGTQGLIEQESEPDGEVTGTGSGFGTGPGP